MAREYALREWLGRRTCYKTGEPEAAGIRPPTNEERAEVELFDFVNDPPYHFCSYWLGQREIGTWTGKPLAIVFSEGNTHRDNMGGTRRPFRCIGVNGFIYAGWAYPSAGDYVRLRRVARRPGDPLVPADISSR